MSLSVELALLLLNLSTHSKVFIGSCSCKKRLGRIMASVASVAYATTIRLGSCMAFVEKFSNRTSIDSDENVFITPYGAGILYFVFSNLLGLTV